MKTNISFYTHWMFAILTCTTAILLSGCSKNEPTPEPTPKQTVKFTSAGITALQTKTAKDNWKNNDEVGIRMINKSGLVVDGNENQMYKTTATGTLSPVGREMFYPMTGEVVDFISYFPYRSDSGDLVQLDVSDQRSDAIDMLYTKTTLGYDQTNKEGVKLSYKHKLSKCVLKITKGENITSLEGLQIAIKGLNTKATFDIAKDQFGAASSITVITPTTVTEGVTYEAIVLPAQTNEMEVVFTLNGTPSTWKVPATEFLSGYKHEWEITINRNKVDGTEGKIDPWEPGQGGTGEANPPVIEKIKFNRDNTCQLLTKHRGAQEFGNTIINGETRTMYFMIDAGEPFLNGELCVGLFDSKTDTIVAWSEPVATSIPAWNGRWLPFNVYDVRPGKYYIRLLARKDGKEWSVCKIADDSEYGYKPDTRKYYEGPELYEYNVIPWASKQPSLDYIRYYNGCEIYTYTTEKKYQMPYRMFNRLNEPLSGTIRLVYERHEIDQWGSWSDVIGEANVTIPANSWKVDSLTMKVTIDRPLVERYCASIRMYWKEQNSNIWVQINNIYNRGKVPELGYELNIDSWVNLNYLNAQVIPASASVE